MNDDRSASVVIDGVEYPMLMSTKATQEICKKYGSLQEMGAKLDSTETYASALGDYVWLMTLFINQGILRYNYRHKDEKKELVNEDYIGIMTELSDIILYRQAVEATINRGTARNIESEEETSKNALNG